MGSQPDPILPEETKKVLRNTFKQMKEKVLVEVFTEESVNQFSEVTLELIKGLASLTDKIDTGFYKLGSERAKQEGITRSPTILISPDKYKIRYVGAPVGEEGRTFIMAIMTASTGGTTLSDSALKRLFELKEPRHIQVFVTPPCPYCPQQAMNAISAAIALPGLVSAEIIEMYENRDFVDKYHIATVPFTVVNEAPIGTGVRNAEVFVEEMLTLTPADRAFALKEGDTLELDLVIVGGGPAGLTAGLYAGRSGLKNVVLEKSTVGGQVLITPIVENYPG
ncbi:MAG TPA: thioredoxin family protein, partial [Dissulfurispiraceae bacterium]